MYLTDVHMHSSFSGDSEEPMENMILKAIDLGLSEICFTEHEDRILPVNSGRKEELDFRCFWLDVPPYMERLMKLRDKYSGRIKVGFGIEIGMDPEGADHNYAVASGYPFDFIIGSTHYVDGYDVYYKDYWKQGSPEVQMGRYFERTLENIRSFNDFDVLGHIDFAARYIPGGHEGVYTFDRYKEVIDGILNFLIENGKGLEINTKALRVGMKEPHPSRDILRRYRELGGSVITIGSDAHSAGEVGTFIRDALIILKECGFSEYMTFSGRRFSAHKIELPCSEKDI